MPHKVNDPVVVAAHISQAFQTLVSRRSDPFESAVVSVTQVHAGSAYNVIPSEAHLCGTVRSFKPAVREMLETGMAQLATGIAQAFGATAEFTYRRGYPATVNHEAQTERAAAVSARSEEHTSELQSLMRISYAV